MVTNTQKAFSELGKLYMNISQVKYLKCAFFTTFLILFVFILTLCYISVSWLQLYRPLQSGLMFAQGHTGEHLSLSAVTIRENIL